ncbi:MAG: F-box protein [Sphingobacteriaceae bacterium]|nr:MAG: F-box protein [Sphingobacteriaceae bacterium]
MMLALPNEILHRILSYVNDPSVLTNCLKTSKSMRKAFFKKKEELLYRS